MFQSFIMSEPNNITTNCAYRIALHLNKINSSLQSLDEELCKYRKEKKDQMYHFYGKHPKQEEKVGLIYDIQNELRVYHYYKQFTLKVLCQLYCYDDEHYSQP